MKRVIRGCFFVFIAWGGLSSSLFLLPAAFADTLLLKNGKELKGLVVENHADRVIFSTEKGEIPILLSGIKKIQYDEPEQNFMQIGRAYEAENKYGEALAYYEKAAEVNPNFEEAKKAAAAMKSRFWAATTEGPQSEMDKQQAIYDSWGQGRSPDVAAKKEISQDIKALRENLGLSLIKRGDWVCADEVPSKKDAAIAGLKRGDCLIMIDAESLRYLIPEVVVKKMTTPRFSSFTLEYERQLRIQKESGGNFSKDLGLKLRLGPEGIVAQKVVSDSPSFLAGLKEDDIIAAIDGQSTRYMPLGKVMQIIRNARQGTVTLSVRRSAMLSRR